MLLGIDVGTGGTRAVLIGSCGGDHCAQERAVMDDAYQQYRRIYPALREITRS